MIALENEEEEVTTIMGGAATIFGLDEESATVEAANNEFDGTITNLMEVRTKLKFVGNAVELKNPEMVPILIDDIIGQMESHVGKQFLLCLHVGTTASANIKNS